VYISLSVFVSQCVFLLLSVDVYLSVCVSLSVCVCLCMLCINSTTTAGRGLLSSADRAPGLWLPIVTSEAWP